MLPYVEEAEHTLTGAKIMVHRRFYLIGVFGIGLLMLLGFSGQRTVSSEVVAESVTASFSTHAVRGVRVSEHGLADWYRKKDDCPKLCAAYPCCPPEELSENGTVLAAMGTAGRTPACGDLAE